MIYGFISFPHKVKTDYDTEIVISDSARLLSGAEEVEMRNAFISFRDKTGVTPAFFTISDSELQRHGGDLYKYSYNLYVDTFNDEKHWLVVYCIGDDNEYWAWEGIIGDDCGSIITTDLENEFTNLLQNNLKSDPDKVSSSVINAFETIGGKSAKIKLNQIPIFTFVLGGFFIYTAVRKVISFSKQKVEDDPRINSVQCPTAEKEPETAKCQYCGGEFVVGVHIKCPHCGAPIENWE